MEMAVHQYKPVKDKLSKWLLTVALLFSIFTFSGYIGISTSQQQPYRNTELVYSINSNAKRNISFERVLTKFNENVIFDSFSKSVINEVLLLHNRIAKTKFDYLLKQIVTGKKVVRFTKLKINPHSSNEDFPHSHQE